MATAATRLAAQDYALAVTGYIANLWEKLPI